VGNNFNVAMSIVKPNIPPLSHIVEASRKMENGHSPRVAIVMGKNSRAWQMDVIAFNITPLTSNL
jgi:hypothetical protein